jgi:hypothetical protein
VVCSGALDFVVHPEIAFRSLCHLALPGGRLVIQVPRASVGGRLYSLGVRACCGFRINLFTVHWLTRQAKRWGLKLIRSQRPLPYNLVALFRRPAALPANYVARRPRGSMTCIGMVRHRPAVLVCVCRMGTRAAARHTTAAGEGPSAG